MSDFFAMGGYAPYVWASYIVPLGLMVWLLIASRRRWKVRERELAEWERIAGPSRGMAGRRETPSPASTTEGPH